MIPFTPGLPPGGFSLSGVSMSKGSRYDRHGWRRRVVKAEVFASEDMCYLCGRPVDKSLPPHLPGSPELDEDIPLSRGGSPYDRRNCHLAHRSCNNFKGNRSTAWARRRLGHPEAGGAETVQVPPPIPFG